MNLRISFGAAVGLAAVALAAGAVAAPRYRTYTNGRYGFSIRYDANLLAPQPEAENGDGRMFLGRRGGRTDGSFISVRVYAGHNSLDRSVKQEMDSMLESFSSGGRPIVSYRYLRKDNYALSGIFGRGREKVFYVRGYLRSGVFTTFTAEYPVAEKSRLDAEVSAMAKSLRPSSGD